MKIQDYFKKTLEDMFLHTKFASKIQYQTLLDEHCQGVAKYVKKDFDGNHKKVIIAFTFDDIVLTYEMIIGGEEPFERIISINYIKEKE